VSLISHTDICNVDSPFPFPFQRNSSKVMSFLRDCQDEPVVSETSNICIEKHVLFALHITKIFISNHKYA